MADTLMAYEVADLIEDSIDNAPAVDAVAVTHGRWIYPLGMAWNYVCSECGSNGDVVCSNYCPHCGAKMDGKGGEA